MNVKVVQDQAIRQALNWAIDRQALARIIYNGLYTPGTGIISSYYKSRGYYTSYANDPEIGYTYDPEKAHQVLEQGGWDCPAVGSDGICTKDGTKAEFTLDLRSSDSQQQNVGLRVKAWAAEVGIKIDLDTITEDALERQDLQPDELQGQGRRQQVRAHVRRVHLGLVRRPDDARLRLRGAGLRQPVVGLVLVRQELHRPDEARGSPSRTRRNGLTCCTRPSGSSSPHRPTSSTTSGPTSRSRAPTRGRTTSPRRGPSASRSA